MAPRQAHLGDPRRERPVHGPVGRERLATDAWVIANLPADAAVPDAARSAWPRSTTSSRPSARRSSSSRRSSRRESPDRRARARHPGLDRVQAGRAAGDLDGQVGRRGGGRVLVAVAIPLAVTVAVVTGLYGAPAVLAIVALVAGMVAMVMLFVAVALTVSTVVNNQAAVAAIGFAVLFLPIGRRGPAPVRHRAVPADVDPRLGRRVRDGRAGRVHHPDRVGAVARGPWRGRREPDEGDGTLATHRSVRSAT